MKTLCLCASVAILLSGCASFVIEQEETADGSRYTRLQGTTFFDSGNTLQKARTTMTDKTQGLSLSGFDQESAGSNAVSLAEKVVESAVRGAVTGAKGF
jgi:hypothetical protein